MLFLYAESLEDISINDQEILWDLSISSAI